MKKALPTVAAVILAMTTLYSPMAPTYATAKENVEKLKIEPKGHAKTIVTETIDYDSVSGEETVQETYGEDLTGKFKVDTESFAASIKNEDTKEKFDLVGKIEKVLEAGKAYYFKGVAENNDLVKFEAIVTKEADKNYEARINIYEYDKKNDEDPISSSTYIFDGESKKTKKYKKKTDRETIKMKKVSDKDGKLRLAAYDEDDKEYYQRIQYASGKGYAYRIQGPLETRTDAGNNYSFRWGTDIADIEEMLEDEGLEYTGDHDVVNFRLRLESNDEPMVFNVVNPNSNSEEEFDVPMWFGTQIGVVDIPVEVNSLTITGNGTDNLLYNFKWNENYYPTGYLDERDFDDDPGNTPGFAVRYYMDTAPSIDTGLVSIDFSGYFKYRSLYNYYSLLLHEFTEITEIDYYYIEIID
ncbi:hypothetical protein [Brevibacillus centrosporus]|uniref:hypothetical protein n=1 Tax=Brevibacillus centrosporus TaxID=54910 RepID=UPI0037FC1CFB